MIKQTILATQLCLWAQVLGARSLFREGDPNNSDVVPVRVNRGRQGLACVAWVVVDGNGVQSLITAEGCGEDIVANNAELDVDGNEVLVLNDVEAIGDSKLEQVFLDPAVDFAGFAPKLAVPEPEDIEIGTQLDIVGFSENPNEGNAEAKIFVVEVVTNEDCSDVGLSINDGEICVGFGAVDDEDDIEDEGGCRGDVGSLLITKDVDVGVGLLRESVGCGAKLFFAIVELFDDNALDVLASVDVVNIQDELNDNQLAILVGGIAGGVALVVGLVAWNARRQRNKLGFLPEAKPHKDSTLAPPGSNVSDDPDRLKIMAKGRISHIL